MNNLDFSHKRILCIGFGVTIICLSASIVEGQDFKIARVASGLNQPNYVTQAPGDSSVIYYTERSSSTIQGFTIVNHMGRVMRYDMSLAGTAGYVGTPVVDLSSRPIFNDDGLEGMAFSPDFKTTGAPGFGKIYVSSSTYNGNGAIGSMGGTNNSVPIDRVEEFTTTDPNNPTVANTTLTRTILQYNNNSQNNHTIDWIGFDPTATGEARNYLYISTGNGSFGNAYNGGVTGTAANPTAVTGHPSQNPADVKGKILRVDVNNTLGDSYPTDSNKNFAIPSDNPVPIYNASHPTAPLKGADTASSPIGTPNTLALGEVWLTGMRNTYRMSFDRANGNIYLGDVGENSVEEVDFMKAGSNMGASQGPVDFGWPEKEGTSNSTVSGAPHTTTNPFTSVTSLLPIQQFTHTVGNAVIGGYVYRGPIASLQGQYFYSDFVTGTVRQLTFDPNTASTSFNGANGTVTDVTSLWNSLVFDPNDPTYTATNASQPFGTAAFGLDHIVSFGESNNGNMFIVDFGGTASDTGFGNATGEYPGPGRGEIFEIVSVPEPESLCLLLLGASMLLIWRRMID